MELIELIKEYSEKLQKNPKDYSCLLFALQIPSICSRIDFPQTPGNTGKYEDGKFYRSNGKAWDSNMYKAWLRNHHSHFKNIYSNSMTIDVFCNSLYELRNQVTHEGIMMSDKNKFYFVESGSAMSIRDTVFIPIRRLCEDMFDAAKHMLSNHHESINITLFNEMLIPSDTFNHIYEDISKIYHSFWGTRPKDDQILNIIYNQMILNKPQMKDDIDKFFDETPNAVFEFWDFGINFGHIIDTEERFIHKDYNESKSQICRALKKNTDVLRLDKQQYAQMLKTVKELELFSNSHLFDITKYIN